MAVRWRRSRRRAVRTRAPAPFPALPNQRWSLDFVHDQMASGRPTSKTLFSAGRSGRYSGICALSFLFAPSLEEGSLAVSLPPPSGTCETATWRFNQLKFPSFRAVLLMPTVPRRLPQWPKLVSEPNSSLFTRTSPEKVRSTFLLFFSVLSRSISPRFSCFPTPGTADA